MIDRDRFFAAARAGAFGGKMSQGQMAGCTTILDGWEARNKTDLRQLAYMLATAKWETAHTMQPVAEYGHGAGSAYGAPDPVTGQTYYGRGYVQLTWKANYQKLSPWVGVDLVNEPDLAMKPDVAAIILFEGMEQGLFTGVGLPRYFNDVACDWVNARRIINGTDRAETIAEIARAFYVALDGAKE